MSNEPRKPMVIKETEPRTCAYNHRSIEGYLKQSRPGKQYQCQGCGRIFTKEG